MRTHRFTPGWSRLICLTISGSALAACFSITSSTLAQFTVVSPNALADTEGPGYGETPTGPFRLQILHPAEDFSDIPPGGAFISGFAFRSDRSHRSAVTSTFNDIRITFSTFSGDSLDSRFESNFGADATVVFDGSFSGTFPGDGPRGGPNPFGTEFVFDPMFFYNPSLGDLLVEPASASGSDVPGHKKDFGPSGGVISDIFSSAGKDAPIAEASYTSILVRRFTIVPEPSSVVLAILAFLGVMAIDQVSSRSIAGQLQ